MEQKLKALIDSSGRILITSHISPDPDAVSSLLLLAEAIRINFPDKDVSALLEEEPANLDFIYGYDKIEFEPISRALETTKPDLFILLDGNNFERCSRHDGAKVRGFITNNNVKTAIIDHHEPDGRDETDVYINRNSPACVQDVYEVCFDGLKLKRPHDSAQTTMTGLYADSGGFAYMKDGSHKRLFELAERLVDDGASVELIKNRLGRFSQDNMEALKQLLSNIKNGGDYTYSYLDDKFMSDWLGRNLTYSSLQLSTGVFLDNFIRNIDGRQWGFIVYANKMQGEGVYSVSLRAVNGVKDVSLIAASLNGGGHKGAAGAKIEAATVTEAINKVNAAIASS